MKIRVVDTEGVGLSHKATKLHNLCYTENGEDFYYTTNHEEMRMYLSEPNVLWAGHNLVRHDWPAIKAVLGLEMSYQSAWDTLAGSWYLFPERPAHGLEALGKEHGIQKVAVSEDQWEEGNPELMKARVVEDVKINWCEYLKQKKRLEEIYGAA